MTGTLPQVVSPPRPGGSSVRLLSTSGRPEWAHHQAVHGVLPATVPQVVQLLKQAGLTGRGGAGFPTWRKIDALTGRPSAIIANAAEGEPLSSKDAMLLREAPQLVLDGLVVLARTLAPRARLILYVNPLSLDAARRAVQDRAEHTHIEVVAAAEGFVSGEVSAVIDRLSGGRGVPRDHPHHLTEKGLKGRPTLVFNAETMAHIALIVRHGAAWFRAQGTTQDPGTRLITLTGTDQSTRVLEVPGGSSLSGVLASGGVEESTVQAALVGGYHGAWISPQGFHQRLSAKPGPEHISAGAGVIHLIGWRDCGLDTSSRILGYLAAASARQCGPCMFGLPTLASGFAEVSRGSDLHLATLHRMLTILPGRGACHHPDGTVRFAASSLEVFTEEMALHQAGRCRASGGDLR